MNLASKVSQDIVIVGQDKELVRIKPDGTLEYGPDYTPDEAARVFWMVLAGARP